MVDTMQEEAVLEWRQSNQDLTLERTPRPVPMFPWSWWTVRVSVDFW